MLIVHAGIKEGQLLLWGEAPPEAQTVLPKRGRGKTKAPQPPRLPYDPGPECLSTALGAALPAFSASSGAAESAVLWLPTVKDQPLASSSLIAESPEPGAAAELKPWTVTALRLTAEQ